VHTLRPTWKNGMIFLHESHHQIHNIDQCIDPRISINLFTSHTVKINLCYISCSCFKGEAGDDYVQFRGPKKRCMKECILIIDSDTGEAILERISDTVQLKATRYVWLSWSVALCICRNYPEMHLIGESSGPHIYLQVGGPVSGCNSGS